MMGLPSTETATSLPSRRRRTVSMLTVRPSAAWRVIRWASSCPGARSSSTERPCASAWVQPNSRVNSALTRCTRLAESTMASASGALSSSCSKYAVSSRSSSAVRRCSTTRCPRAKVAPRVTSERRNSEVT